MEQTHHVVILGFLSESGWENLAHLMVWVFLAIAGAATGVHFVRPFVDLLLWLLPVDLKKSKRDLDGRCARCGLIAGPCGTFLGHLIGPRGEWDLLVASVWWILGGAVAGTLAGAATCYVLLRRDALRRAAADAGAGVPSNADSTGVPPVTHEDDAR